jgi:hypothetical protein
MSRRITISIGLALGLAAWIVAAVLAAGVGWDTIASVRQLAALIQVDAHHQTKEKADFLEVFGWLREHTPPTAVIGFYDLTDDRFGRPGYTQLASRIVLEADRATLLGNQVEATRAHNGEVLQHLQDWEPERIVTALRRYDVSYLVSWVDEVDDNLSRSDAFRLAYRSGNVRVWAVAGPTFRAATGEGVVVDAFDRGHEQARWTVRSDGAVPLTLAVPWHPNWRATSNGTPVQLTQTDDHLMQLTTAAGASEVRIEFVRPWWNAVVNVVSAAAVLATVVWWWRRGIRV